MSFSIVLFMVDHIASGLELLNKELQDFVDEVFRLSQENLVSEGKVDTANLLKSGNVDREFLKAKIRYSAPYADDVHFGRTPGSMPPTDALLKWVRRKLNVQDDKKARRVAFAVAMAIKQRGIQEFPYLIMAAEKADADKGIAG